MFGEKSLHMAKKLLVDAAHQEADPEIQVAISRRIKDIDSKQECTKQL
jgi:hypothetical protein